MANGFSLFAAHHSLFAAAYLRRLLLRDAAFEDAHDVGLLHDQEILTFDLHFGAGPFAEQHEIACLHFGNDPFAVLVERAGTYGDDFAFLRLLLDGIGNDDATRGLLIFLKAADDHAVAKRTEFHGAVSLGMFNIYKRLRFVPGVRAFHGSTLAI